MALINCPECNKEISDSARKCPHCGYPLKEEVEVIYEKKKGFWSTGRLAVSIISFVLALFIIYQGYMLTIAEALIGEEDGNGILGIGVALFIVLAAIIGLCTRNKRGIGPFISAVLYFFSYILSTAGDFEEYPDLELWGIIALIFAVFFCVCSFAKSKNNKEKIRSGSDFASGTFFLTRMMNAYGPTFLLFAIIVVGAVLGLLVKMLGA